jgi:hypothetical protein
MVDGRLPKSLVWSAAMYVAVGAPMLSARKMLVPSPIAT